MGEDVSVREPAVAGTFYPRDARRLRETVKACVTGTPAPALAAMVPHAGYVYSGAVAGAVFGAMEIPDTVVILHFNHRGAEEQFAVWTRGAWRTPLGDAEIDGAAARAIAEACGLEADPPLHAREHSGEVQIPFIQVRNPRARIVPIALSGWISAAARLAEIGTALAGATGTLVIASSDMNHYEADGPTRRKDAAVTAAIERLDAEAMIEAIERFDVSMCGAAPALAMIAYARGHGATSARLVRYDTSATASGDADRVVGYAGLIVDRP